MSPASRSPISSDAWLNETRAPFTTARSEARTPSSFRFAPKLSGNRPRMLADFGPRVRALGDRLGPIRVQLISARDEGMIELILGSLEPGLLLAFDLAHPSWDGIEPRLAQAGAVRVND